ncbi:carbohydrate esterase family 5 protein [Hyaloscypha hepaticicola]|uniref:Cutinase n=1 Tax=Hyaloscypha hepaticicola TaxID=2082293 RepID=A0A2J6QLA0_9HELO|nr:carbohydrate esterase family 5 protein [Hyaloscypha hepaticicola]
MVLELRSGLATPAFGKPINNNAARLQARQTLVETSNELEDGPCKDVFFIFARGSTEPGNMGEIVGPQTCSDLKSALGDSVIGCQGVGSPYDATLADNFLPQNTSPQDIGAATTLFDLANSKCPNSKIVAGGYSQGTAVMDGSIQALPAAIQNKIYGVVLFGFTRNQQDGGRIPNYPTSQTKVYCAVGDLVCDGTLIITAAHLSYGVDAPSAASFLVQQLGM